MNKNYVGTYGVIKKNGGIDLLCSENEGEGNIFFSILKCIEENDDYLKVIVIGKRKEYTPKIAIIKREGYEILKKPKFDVGDKVRLIKYPNEIAIVKEIIWHEKNRRIYKLFKQHENDHCERNIFNSQFHSDDDENYSAG